MLYLKNVISALMQQSYNIEMNANYYFFYIARVFYNLYKKIVQRQEEKSTIPKREKLFCRYWEA